MSQTMSSETGIPHKERRFGGGGDDHVRVKANPYSRGHGSYLVKSVTVRGRTRETKQARKSGELKGDGDDRDEVGKWSELGSRLRLRTHHN